MFLYPPGHPFHRPVSIVASSAPRRVTPPTPPATPPASPSATRAAAPKATPPAVRASATPPRPVVAPKRAPVVHAKPSAVASKVAPPKPTPAEVARAAATADRVRNEVDRLLGHPMKRAADLKRLDVAMGLCRSVQSPRLLGRTLVFGGSDQGGAPLGALRANAALDAAFGIVDPHRAIVALATGAA